jgi:hypothetical protein
MSGLSDGLSRTLLTERRTNSREHLLHCFHRKEQPIGMVREFNEAVL